MTRQDQIENLCKAIWEMARQAPHDFGGEQREFYLPRLNEAMVAAATLYPAQFSRVVGVQDEEAPP